MTTQTLAEVTNVLKAYVFVMCYREEVRMIGSIASNHAEAEADVKARYSYLSSGDLDFFNCTVALMQPAMIERWEKEKQWGPQKRIEEKGSYAFLEGMFFGAYGNKRIVSGCAKHKTMNGWGAIIYGHNHYIKPL